MHRMLEWLLGVIFLVGMLVVCALRPRIVGEVVDELLHPE